MSSFDTHVQCEEGYGLVEDDILLWEGVINKLKFRMWLHLYEDEGPEFYTQVYKNGLWRHWDTSNAADVAEQLIQPFMQEPDWDDLYEQQREAEYEDNARVRQVN